MIPPLRVKLRHSASRALPQSVSMCTRRATRSTVQQYMMRNAGSAMPRATKQFTTNSALHIMLRAAMMWAMGITRRKSAPAIQRKVVMMLRRRFLLHTQRKSVIQNLRRNVMKFPIRFQKRNVSMCRRLSVQMFQLRPLFQFP